MGITRVLALGSFLLCASCAFNLATIKYEPAELNTPTETAASFTLTEDLRVDKSPCNYDRTLKAGTIWAARGEIEQGTVYRSSDQILTIECSHVFEAYLVVKDMTLVGVYLPVEKGFVALKRNYPLITQP
jgi:hypothetical protein